MRTNHFESEPLMEVKDIQTNQVFALRPYADREDIITRDGQRVRLFPLVIKTMVRVRQQFDGLGQTGSRPMVRIS